MGPTLCMIRRYSEAWLSAPTKGVGLARGTLLGSVGNRDSKPPGMPELDSFRTSRNILFSFLERGGYRVSELVRLLRASLSGRAILRTGGANFRFAMIS